MYTYSIIKLLMIERHSLIKFMLSVEFQTFFLRNMNQMDKLH